MFTRRTAVLRLAQMVAGGSLGEAAGYLGIAATDTTHERKGRIYSGAGHVHRIAKMHPDPYAFETALNALAGELDQPSTQLVNYQQRRRALEAWSIDADTWDDLIARLSGPQEPELGDRKRQIASIYIWVQITSGEHHFAPRPIEAAQPAHIQHAWKLRRNTIWHLKETYPAPTTPASKPNSTPSPPPSPERSTLPPIRSRQQNLETAIYNWGSHLTGH